MQCKIEGCRNRTWALNGLCLECEAKVRWLAHNKLRNEQTEKEEAVRK